MATGMVLTALQRSVLFPGTGMRAPDIGDALLAQHGIQRWWLPIDGGQVEAWYLPATAVTAPAPAIVFAHGNGELIDMWPEALRRFNDLGHHLLLVEYPGYGRSTGDPGLETVTQGFVAAYDRLVTQPAVDANNIVGFGRSLGGGAITALARERHLSALLLASTFTSVADMAKRMFLPGFLVNDKFDNLAVVKKFAGPVLVIHGDQDELIPFRHGEKLAAAAAKGQLIAYPAGHNDCPPDWERFWQDVGVWLSHL